MDPPEISNWPTGRVGFVAIVGRPNVGKSTFLNGILGCHLVAVSAKPQTTRKHWRGILSDDDSQIVFVDTPGIHEARTKLDDAMLRSVRRSLEDADLVLCLCDALRPGGAEDDLTATRVREAGKPTILAVNKIDNASPAQQAAMRSFFLERLGTDVTAIALSARHGDNVPELLEAIRAKLPRGPFFYPPDQLTDAFERDIGSEIIREAAIAYLREEIPHSLATEIIQWDEKEKRLRIDANLYVEHESQKPVVIGRHGDKLKKIRKRAIELLREWQDRRIDLNLHVRVKLNWRNRPGFLRELGM